MGMKTCAAMAAAVLALTCAAPGEEVVENITITTELVTPGIFFNDWDVTAEFDIVRDEKPDDTVYFQLYLEETDVTDDEEFGPVTIKVEPWQWTQGDDGKWRARVKAKFSDVSDYYGTDWTVDDDDIVEVECQDSVVYAGGTVDLVGPTYVYTYTVQNDPTAIAMDPGIGVVSATFGDLHHEFVPPIANGDLGEAIFFDDRAPPPDGDEVPGPSTVTVRMTLTTGDVLEALAVGPAPQGCLADFNGDGQRDILDFVAFQIAFSAGDPRADANGDGQLNILDFVTFQQRFQQGC